MEKIGELLRNTFAIYAYITAITLMALSGFGLSGKYLLIFFSSLLFIFIWHALFQDSEHVKLRYRSIFFFNLKIILVLLGIIAWVSITDYYLVELFKIYAIDISETAYWKIMFGGLIPVILTTFSVLYYIGSNHISNSIRILILSAFFLNSNLNDILYYKLFSEALPNNWTWVTQPKFLFSSSLTKNEVITWMIISLTFGIIAALFPYEILVWNKAEDSNDFKRTNRQRLIEIIILIVFTLSNIFFAGKVVTLTQVNLNKIRNEYSKQLQNTSQKIEEQLNKLSLNNEPLNTEEQRLTIAFEIIQILQDGYRSTGEYPISTGNCNETWDSSNNGLPFNTVEKIFKDPAEINNDNCFLDQENSRILYYSDGQQFALLLNGQNINKNSNLYVPGTNDVSWFDSETYFNADWEWNTKMLVYMFSKGSEITNIQ